jgi:cell division protein FtsB
MLEGGGPSSKDMALTIRIAADWFYRMRRVLATLCIGVLAVFIGYKVIFGANGMKIYEGKRAEAVRLQQQIDDEKIKNEQLQRRVDNLQREDPSAIEKEAREQLGYVKAGEVVLVEPQAKFDGKRTPVIAESSGQQ